MKTSELTGAALDWAGAKCEGREFYQHECDGATCMKGGWTDYSTDWAQAGPIIEREKIRLDTTWNQEDGRWSARMDTVGGWWPGDTPLIAAMRCYVASKLGDTVDVPKELTC